MYNEIRINFEHTYVIKNSKNKYMETEKKML